MMLDAEAANTGCGLVSAEDFYYPANRAVFEAAEAARKAGAAVDAVTLWGGNGTAWNGGTGGL